MVFYPSRSHSGKHHSERHYPGGNRIIRCAPPSLGEMYQVEHVGSGAESVAELLYEHAGVDGKD